MTYLPSSLIRGYQTRKYQAETQPEWDDLQSRIDETVKSTQPAPEPEPQQTVVQQPFADLNDFLGRPSEAVQGAAQGVKDAVTESVPFKSLSHFLGYDPEAEKQQQMGARPITGSESVPSNGVQPVMRGAVPQGGEIESYIRQAAARRGIDPEIAVKVALSEGGLDDPVRQSDYVDPKTGQREESYGPFQLYMGGGLGNSFQKTTGKSPSDPTAWRQAVDFALDEAARGGWGPWYGAARVGIGNRQGLEAAKATGIEPDGGVQAGGTTPMPAPGQSTSAAFDTNTIAKQWQGLPYVFGGAGGRSTGVAPTDCSGFVSEVFKEQGLDLPAHTDAAYNYLQKNGQVVDLKDARPSDVVFYMGAGTGGAITHHMGLYAGPGKVLDMSVAGGGGVKERPIGHAGEYVIMRDPRLNPPVPPQRAEEAPAIVPTGIAERTGGQKIKGVDADRAVSQYGGLAMEDLSGAAPVATTSSEADTGSPLGADNTVRGASGGIKGLDKRGDYAPRAVEPGDFEIPGIRGGPGVVLENAPGQPLETAPIPSTRPADAVEPVSEAQAPASAGNPLTQLADWFQGGADLLRKALQPANDAAVGALNAGADAIGTTFQRGRENPSPSQQLGNMVMDQAGDLVQSNVENWSNVAAKATGDRIGHRMTPEEQQAATERSLRIIESNPFAPGVYSAVPEVIGMASTSREALDRLAAQKRAGGLIPAPTAGIVSRAQADEAVGVPGVGNAPGVAGNATPPPTDRYYHGTSADFVRPDAGEFRPDGLFGPGYYVTSDPRVAGSGDALRPGYAEGSVPSALLNFDQLTERATELRAAIEAERQRLLSLHPGTSPFGVSALPDADEFKRLSSELGQVQYSLENASGPRASGPNIRPVDVPRDLRLLDADAPAGQSLVNAATDEMERRGGDSIAETFENALDHYVAQRVRKNPGSHPDVIGEDIWKAAAHTYEGDTEVANWVLRDMGYDGIRYAGGKRIPMMDDAGKAIEHNAVVIFPESLDKIRNATAGTRGGADLGENVQRARQGLSPVGREVIAKYDELTPQRAEAARQDVLARTMTFLGEGLPDAERARVQNLVEETHRTMAANLEYSKVVSTSLEPPAVNAYLRTGRITTKADLPYEQGVDTTRRQVSGAAAAARKRGGVDYEQGMAGRFYEHEAESIQGAMGGHRFPNPAGIRDEDAPRHLYAHVTDGQPMVSAESPALRLIWKNETPRVTSESWPYALRAPAEGIHASATSRMKPVKELYQDQTTVRGATYRRNADGTIDVVGWDERGVGLPSGRKIMDTDHLVGPEGENVIRANNLLLAMPEGIQRQIRSGQISDPRDLAALLQRGDAGRQKYFNQGAIAPNRTRSESLIIDPDVRNVKAILLTGPESALGGRVELVPNAATGRTGGTRLETARAMRRKILEDTGEDVPILWKDPTDESKLLSGAKVIEGPDITLAPGRGQDIRDRYVAMGERDIGLLPSGARDTASGANELTGAAARAVGAGVGAGYQESQQEGSTPESVLAHGIGGAVTSGGNSLAGRLIGRKGVTLLSRAVQSSEPTAEDLTHVRGFGILKGVSDDAREVLERAAAKGRQYPEGVGFDEMDNVIKEVGIDSETVRKKWASADTREAAAEAETLRRGVAATINDFMDDARRITDLNDSSPDVIMSAGERLADAAAGSEWLLAGRRAGESAGRALAVFRHQLDAGVGRQLFEALERTSRDVQRGADVLDSIKTGKGGNARMLDTAADGLDAIGKQVQDADKVLEKFAQRTPPDELAKQMKVREDMKRTLDRALQSALNKERMVNVRTEVEDMGRTAKEIIGQIIENTSDTGLRDDLAETLGRMREHSNVGDVAATRLQEVFDQRMDTWAKNFTRNVDQRVAGAEKAAQKAMDQESVKALSDRLREMATLVRSGNRDPRLLEGIDDMRIAMMDYGKMGKDRSYEVKQALTRQGLIRFAGKIDEDKITQFTTLLRTIDPERPETLARVMHLMNKGTFTDSIIEYAIANMLSSPSTQAINVTSNAMQGAAYLGIKKPLMVVVDRAFHGADARQVYGSELGASWEGLTSAFGTGLQAAGETMRHGYSKGTMERAAQIGDFSGVRREILTDKFGAAGALLHAISTRPLQAADEMFGSMLYSANLYALAERRARQTGGTRDAILRDLASNLDLVDQSGKLSDYSLLKSKDSVTDAIAGLGRMRDGTSNPGAEIAKHLLFPFVRTPWNVLKQGIEFSPVGTAANLGKLMVQGDKNPLRATDIGSNVVSGLGLAAMGSTLWANGNISGDGPTDLEKRKMLESEGWRPRSIRVGDQWVSYDSTPFTIPLGSLVTGLERYQEAVEKGQAKASPEAMWQGVMGFGVGTASSFLNQSFVKNAADIYEDVRQGDVKPGSLAANVATRYIPAGSMVAYLARLGDSVQRETRMVDNPALAMIQERTPLRGQLPARQDVLGREAPNDQSAPSGILPAPRRSTVREDPVISAFQSAGVDIGAPPKEITVDEIKIDLSPGERQAWQKYRGAALERMTQSTMRNGNLERIPAIAREGVLREIMADANEVATEQLQASMGKDLTRRVKEKAAVRR